MYMFMWEGGMYRSSKCDPLMEEYMRLRGHSNCHVAILLVIHTMRVTLCVGIHIGVVLIVPGGIAVNCFMLSWRLSCTTMGVGQ